MDNRYNKIAKNTIIYAIGNFGSKILSFIIVPFYTYVLTTEEYGIVDLFTTTAGFILPLITLSIQEALMRFLLGKETSGKVAASNSFIVFIFGCVLSVLFIPIYLLVFKSWQNIGLFYAFLILSSFTQIYSQYLRSSGDVVSYTINGILITVATLVSNVLLLLVVKAGMIGYLFSMLFAQTASAIFLILKGKLWEQIRFSYVDKTVLKEMLRYSIPLIPNSIMWWVMAGGDRYIINHYLGAGANGIFSLASKIPGMINMLYTFFYQAWQMSAIEEHKSSDQKEFYSNIFKVTNALLSISVVVIVMCVKPLYLWMMSSSFKIAWKYVPVLSLASAISCYGSFFGVIYAVNKNTKMASVTTFIGAVVNIGFNLIFVRMIGLHGVTIGTLLGYLAVTIIRARDTYNEIYIDFDVSRLSITVLVLIIQSVITVCCSTMIGLICGFISFSILCFLYKNEILKLLQLLLSKFNRRSI